MTDDPRQERDPLGLLSDFQRSTRMPLDAVVRLHFEGTVAYQNGFAANVSALGMFVKHPDPPAVGTRLVFEFVLGDERKPVQGGGVVTWVRERYEGPGRPAGVGIQFSELDALSRQHIAESLFEFLETQLGVEVADHPDVPDLLAAMPKSTVVEVGGDESAAPAAGAGEAQGELGFAAADEAEAETPPVRAAEPAPVRLFGDSPPGGLAVEDFETPREELFAPVTQPAPAELAPPAFGAARRRESSAWLPFVITFGIAAAGIAGWWFLWGPGAESRARLISPPVFEAESQPAPPPRPPLDPQPGPARTLADAVGATPATAAPEPAGAGETEAREGLAAAAPTVAAAATRITDIRWRTVAGGTDVTLAADGELRPGGYRWYEMRDARPRVLVRLTGMAAGYPSSSLDVGSPELASIRVGFHQKAAGNELHIVLDLANGNVEVAGVEGDGNELVVRLRAP